MNIFKKIWKAMDLNVGGNIKELEKRELSPIEKDNWIEVYFTIIYTKQKKKETEKESESFIYLFCEDVLDILFNISRVINSKGEIGGYLSPSNRLIYSNEGIPPVFSQTLLRNFSFKTRKEKNDYHIKIRAKNQDLKQEGNQIRDCSKDKGKVYGYSPTDFATDKDLIYILKEHINKIVGLEKQTSVFNGDLMDFYIEKKEPCVRVISGTLITKYKMRDRIKLYRVNPTLEKRAFLEDVNSFIDFVKKQHKNTKGMKEWINEVDKLIKK